MKTKIVAFDFVPISEIAPNPKNWRRHNKTQAAIVEQSLSTIGWVKPLVVNVRSKKIIDGHLRLMLAQSHGVEKIPVLYIDASEEEELLFLLALDTLSEMATANNTLLEELLNDCSAVVDENTKSALLGPFASKEPLPEHLDPAKIWDSFGFPDFHSEWLRPKYKIQLLFKTTDDKIKLGEKLAMTVSAKTKYINLPPQQWNALSSLAVLEEETC